MRMHMQSTLLRSGRGEEIVQETRLWDEFKLATYSMRKKEGLADYRWAECAATSRTRR